ncbi:CBS domain-containing protein [Falsiroseomonas sp. CW058]|uniref:CBS domain-containing protein n=1 Tax=Falsiroseomonas sp. CW058 TaxID=3388664 RepID=UPI003D3240F6
MLARDLMTTTPITLPPDLPLAAVARIFAERGISGAPVVDAEGRLLGMVTEGDLVHRLAATERKKPGWLTGLLATAGQQAEQYARLHGRTAADVMTRHLVTAEEDTPVEKIAKALEDRHIRRVPVLRGEVLVGVVSRADLIRAVMAPPAEPAGVAADDERIRRDLRQAMRGQAWIDAFYIFPDVRDGVVMFHGWCRNEEVKRGLRVLAEGIPGVKGVQVMVEKPPLPVLSP